ncbi:hypothetical protein BOX15_Mlig001067g3 [Macrostomum lignano]|uniref:Kazal-like domain-containing protein n=1 Tax=Macrostomum lignano TaxID=282301 RepID=A0A267DLU9_9PLAT|nr:hypothetical protein BOX15_Mlig001067g3 [Macrostomum lignano]
MFEGGIPSRLVLRVQKRLGIPTDSSMQAAGNPPQSRAGQSPQRPVCGTDGRTYPDQCSLDYESCYSRLNISRLSDGQCPFGVHCQTWCPHEYMECRVDPGSSLSACRCPTDCPPVFSPVCGTDEVTYESDCHLRRSACLSGRRGVRPAYRGECDQPLWCIRQRPGGRCPHGGICRVGIVETSVAAAPTWSVRAGCERPECVEPLTLMWLPGAAAAAEEAESRRVCGSDGVTYRSDCHLRQRAFDTRKSSLTVAGRGSCNPCQGVTCPYYGVCTINVRGEPVCQCPNSCLYVNDPVCGTDGLTYTLECDLHSYACNNKLDIRVASKGSCPSPRQQRRRRRRHIRRLKQQP